MRPSDSRNRCKKVANLATLVATVFLGCFLPLSVRAQSPVVGNGGVTSGQATITQSYTTTNVNQSTQAASINWQSFNIGSNSVVNFNQPNSTSVTLNRVTGTENSVIDGVLNANGYVFLLNGNGILMTKGSSINTAGFLASTLDISNENFKAGKYIFQANGSAGSVINMGTITAKDGGYVALLGNKVSNQGVIIAMRGTVAMAAGSQITLNFNGNSLVGVTIDKGALDALVENKQAIYADGGKVILTATAADDLITAQVNNSGLIQARTLDDVRGDIQLLVVGGTVNLNGTLDASAPTSGSGGMIETSGDKVIVDPSAVISTIAANGATGTWLIDPDGFTIAPAGGDISGAALSKELGTTNVVISSTEGSGLTGNVDVNDTVSWSANTSLSLQATNDINVNQAITATGANAGLNLTAGNNINIINAVQLSGASSGLTINYGGDYNILTPASYAGAVLNGSGIPVANTDTSNGVYGSVTLSGANAGLNINGSAYTLIHTMNQLDALDNYDAATGTYLNGATSATTVSGNYAVAQNLDATGVTYANSPIQSFSGTLAGLGHTISNLTINAPSVSNVGLIGQASGATLRDIGLINANVNGFANVGTLLGYGTTTDTTGLTVKDAYGSGQVSASNGNVGGLIGEIFGGPQFASISYADSSANVTSTAADVLTYDPTGTTVTGVSLASPAVGGLIGEAYYAAISNSDATGAVKSVTGYTGGLAGLISGNYVDASGNNSASLSPTVTNSYATGSVTETTTSLYDYGSATGGLIGWGSGINVSNSFAKGSVSGYDQVGGLIGLQENNSSGFLPPYLSVDNTYATGNVSSIGDYTASALEGSATGGLIGYAEGANVTNSFATGNATSSYEQAGATGPYAVAVGGLIGAFTGGTVSNTYATGNVTGAPDGFAGDVGGLIGLLNIGTLTDSHATGRVTGSIAVGGLVGLLYNPVFADYFSTATVSNSVAYGEVNGVSDVGGVVGFVGSVITGSNSNPEIETGTVTDVASYSNVTGTGDYVGGIAGYGAELTVSFSNSYGSVQGNDNVGGVAGYAKDITDSNAYGTVNSDSVNFASANGAATTMSNQTGDTTLSEAQDDAQTPRQSTAEQMERSILFDDSSNYSATVKTVIVDGVEYQVNDDSATQEQKKPEVKKKEENKK